ncbi:MAG: CPBP family intramembrane metalloprotease [bacterium]|nr:CPBP family intramembrane metalloprotease [bacterium]
MQTTSVEHTESNEQEPAKVVKYWRRIPVLLRSIISGFAVFFVFQAGAGALFLTNMKVLPNIPWSLPIGLAYLWLVFQFFNGRWGSARFSRDCRQSMRARFINPGERLSAFGAGLSVMVFFIATTIMSYRLVVIAGEELPIDQLPWWTVYSILILVSIVAGVAEESGFRGYMQGPLEKRYGPVAAISVGALFFWLAHLNHANGVPRFAALFIMGASLGALAWSARSIYPAIIAHASADTLIFLGSVSEIGPDYFWAPEQLSETGIDGFFWVVLITILVTGFSGAFFMRKLRRLTAED